MSIVGENGEFHSQVFPHGASQMIAIFVQISPAWGKGSDQRDSHAARKSARFPSTRDYAWLRKRRGRDGSERRKHEWRLHWSGNISVLKNQKRLVCTSWQNTRSLWEIG